MKLEKDTARFALQDTLRDRQGRNGRIENAIIANGDFYMWNETKQLQLNELQRRELENSLTAEEGQTLEKLLSELEQAEWQTLDPELEREREAEQIAE